MFYPGFFLPSPDWSGPVRPKAQISCGARHSAVVDKSGAVYTSGCNLSGQLGRSLQSPTSNRHLGRKDGSVSRSHERDPEVGRCSCRMRSRSLSPVRDHFSHGEFCSELSAASVGSSLGADAAEARPLYAEASRQRLPEKDEALEPTRHGTCTTAGSCTEDTGCHSHQRCASRTRYAAERYVSRFRRRGRSGTPRNNEGRWSSTTSLRHCYGGDSWLGGAGQGGDGFGRVEWGGSGARGAGTRVACGGFHTLALASNRYLKGLLASYALQITFDLSTTSRYGRKSDCAEDT